MTVSKILQAAASSSGGGGTALDVDDVFSTYLYTGNGTDNRAINNGIDLSGNGGMVWIKNRDFAFDHLIGDTERGITKGIRSNTTAAENNFSDRIKTVTSTGFTIGTADEINSSNTGYTGSLMEYVSWTFRKAARFFDVVTYTGNGTSQNVNHSLGSIPGMIIVKRYDAGSENWAVYHRGLGTNPETKYVNLNLDSAATANTGYWNDTAPTYTHFTVGANGAVNNNGGTYIAYLFANNNNDGRFGPLADQDIIKCGNYAGNGSGEYDDNGTEINLNFEPQWIMIKSYTGALGDWQIFDTMRGITARPTSSSRDGDDAVLFPNLSHVEDGASSFLRVTPTGFKLESDNSSVNSSGHSYIYVAIRRGPLTTPTSASDVFTIDTLGSTGDGLEPGFRSSFVVDWALQKNLIGSGENWELVTRLLQGSSLRPNSSNAIDTGASDQQFDYQNGFNTTTSANGNVYAWMWKRAPGFCDVVAYTGTGSATTVTHNLGVPPEMIWVKQRNTSQSWQVFHSGLDATEPEDYYMILNSAAFRADNSNRWNDIAPTSSVFTIGTAASVNGNGDTYVAYLFATLAGVSKVGSYTGNGSTSGLTIDCGFSNGAKLIIIKAYGDNSNDADWYVFDSVRGITNGNDPWLELNTNYGETSVGTAVKPDSSGFQVVNTTTTGHATINKTGETYIFYAVAI